MRAVVYALFAEAAAAEAADAEVRASGSRDASQVPVLVTSAPVDGNALPDSATGYGRNLVIAMIAGALVMATAGAVAGALDLMLGMGVGMGIGLGLLTGLLMGLVGAMQAGTRIPKPALRELEPRIREGAVLLVVETEETAAVLEIVKRHDPETAGTLGAW
jgi:ABC-type dipeptide/oligopeptide/nickel transport system permease subunit